MDHEKKDNGASLLDSISSSIKDSVAATLLNLSKTRVAGNNSTTTNNQKSTINSTATDDAASAVPDRSSNNNSKVITRKRRRLPTHPAISEQFEDADESDHLRTTAVGQDEVVSSSASASDHQEHDHSDNTDADADADADDSSSSDPRSAEENNNTATTTEDGPEPKKARTTRHEFTSGADDQQPAADASDEERPPSVVTPEPSLADANATTNLPNSTTAHNGISVQHQHHHHHHFLMAHPASMIAQHHHQANLFQGFLNASAYEYFNGNFAQAPSQLVMAAISQRKQQLLQHAQQQQQQHPSVTSSSSSSAMMTTTNNNHNLQPILPNPPVSLHHLPTAAASPFLGTAAAATTPTNNFLFVAPKQPPHNNNNVPYKAISAASNINLQEQWRKKPIFVANQAEEQWRKQPIVVSIQDLATTPILPKDEIKEGKIKQPQKESSKNKAPKGKKYAAKQVDKWTKRYEQAKEFAKKYGHCVIPNEYEEIPGLGSWAKRQRYQYQIFQKGSPCTSRVSSMNTERIQLLDRIGFCWHHKDRRWLSRYSELLQFINDHAHAAVPTVYPENQELAGWVKVQRRQHKLYTLKQKSSMTEERIKLLNKVGFIWSIKDLSQDFNTQSYVEVDDPLQTLMVKGGMNNNEKANNNNKETRTTNNQNKGIGASSSRQEAAAAAEAVSRDEIEKSTREEVLAEAKAAILKKDRTIILPTKANKKATPDPNLKRAFAKAAANAEYVMKSVANKQPTLSTKLDDVDEDFSKRAAELVITPVANNKKSSSPSSSSKSTKVMNDNDVDDDDSSSNKRASSTASKTAPFPMKPIQPLPFPDATSCYGTEAAVVQAGADERKHAPTTASVPSLPNPTTATTTTTTGGNKKVVGENTKETNNTTPAPAPVEKKKEKDEKVAALALLSFFG